MTVRYLLDTNVLSEWMRPQPDAAVLAWVRQQSPGHLYTSAVTVAEIEAGLALMPYGHRQRALHRRQVILRQVAGIRSRVGEHLVAFV
jgi:predicted nucleic acid-binding protein